MDCPNHTLVIVTTEPSLAPDRKPIHMNWLYGVQRSTLVFNSRIITSSLLCSAHAVPVRLYKPLHLYLPHVKLLTRAKSYPFSGVT